MVFFQDVGMPAGVISFMVDHDPLRRDTDRERPVVVQTSSEA